MRHIAPSRGRALRHSHDRRSTVAGVAVPALLLLLAGPADAPAQDLQGMPSFEEVHSVSDVGSVAVSPDGRSVAYTVVATDWEENRYDTEIWLARDGEEPFQLTRTEDGSSTSPSWSPDGRWIAFLADRGEETQVHLIDPRGGEAFALIEMEEGVQEFEWAPDGSRMVLRVREPADERSEALDEAYGDFVVEDAEYRNSHLWLVEVARDGTAGEAKRLTGGDFHVADARWSPDAASLALVVQPTSQLLSFMESDIRILDVASGELRDLVTGPGPDGSPVWSPDGEWILFSEAPDDLGSLFYLNGELARIPAAGGEIAVLTAGFDEEPGGAVWTEAGIRFSASHRTERRLYALDPESGSVTPLPAPAPVVGSYDFTPDGRRVALTGRGPESLDEVYLGAAGSEDLPHVTRMTEQVAGWPLGTREVIRWESEDGAEIEGVLYKPANYDPDRAYPLLVQIHGGPTGTSRPDLLPTSVYPVVHWLARGALVLQPNYRGSAGYGEAFRSLNVRNLGVGDMWDVMSGVKHLVDRGAAHPDSLGAMGWSQGGYISAFLTTNTDAFQAISVGAGISDWMTYYVNTDIHPFTRQYLKGTPWDDPDVYAKTSPMTNIRQASTPTLIQHGEFDARVPIPNAYQLYQGLLDQGVETRLIVYKRFGHGISRPKERLAATWHNWQWFARHIWGEDVELPVKVDGEDGKVPEGGGG